jgi:hypothetical protein
MDYAHPDDRKLKSDQKYTQSWLGFQVEFPPSFECVRNNKRCLATWGSAPAARKRSHYPVLPWSQSSAWTIDHIFTRVANRQQRIRTCPGRPPVDTSCNKTFIHSDKTQRSLDGPFKICAWATTIILKVSFCNCSRTI